MTPPEAEDRFQRYLASTENYNAAIRAAGRLPWFENPERRAKVARRVGLPADAPGEQVRRALFLHHHQGADPCLM